MSKKNQTVLMSTIIPIIILSSYICQWSAPTDKFETVAKPEVTVVQAEEPTQVEPQIYLTDEEVELIALVTMAEAEGESEEGKRLVIDTILNRVESDVYYWPDTVYEVIYQPHQFTSMWNGRVNRCYVRDDICQLVREEAISRTNNEVVFFRMGRYSDYGVPMFKLGCHYFSSYE